VSLTLQRMDDGARTGPIAAGGWLARVRWRRRGAWMWPAFLGLTVIDGIIGTLLPGQGDSTRFVGAMLFGAAINLLAIVLLSWPLGLLLRRRRPDFPSFIARDYAGTLALSLVTVALLIVGLLNHASVEADHRAMDDAVVRAQAYIGDHAPAEFVRNMAFVTTFVIQPRTVYRVCVPGRDSGRTYCVIVRVKLPFGRSVSFSGYEPNAELSQGAN
jgi:hypothetical protein